MVLIAQAISDLTLNGLEVSISKGSGSTVTREEFRAIQSSVTMPQGSTGNRVFEANWIPIEYSINYSLNSGDASNNPSSYTIETPTITLNSPTRTGYTFAGWSEENTILLTKEGSEIQSNNNVYYGPYYKTTAGYYRIDIYGTDLDKATYNAYENATTNVKLCYKEIISSTHVVLVAQAISDLTAYGLEVSITKSGGSIVTREELRAIQSFVTIHIGSTGNKSYQANWKERKYIIKNGVNQGYTWVSKAESGNGHTSSGAPTVTNGSGFITYTAPGGGSYVLSTSQTFNFSNYTKIYVEAKAVNHGAVTIEQSPEKHFTNCYKSIFPSANTLTEVDISSITSTGIFSFDLWGNGSMQIVNVWLE